MDNNTESVISNAIGAILVIFLMCALVKCSKDKEDADVEKYRIEMEATSPKYNREVKETDEQH